MQIYIAFEKSETKIKRKGILEILIKEVYE